MRESISRIGELGLGDKPANRTVDFGAGRALLSSTALAGLLAIGSGASPALAQCAPAGSPNYTCSGANATTQSVIVNNANVATSPGFSVDTTVSGGGALVVTGAGDIRYIDANAAPLTAGLGGRGLEITATGDDGATPGAVTVSTGGVISGGLNGIWVGNLGTGDTSITATGQVTGTGDSGIYVGNSSNANNLTLNAASVTGNVSGIFAINQGSGATSVTATGQVTGTNDAGIYAENGSTATSLTVNAASVTGGFYGIWAGNSGTGATSVTATGQVTGTNAYGIFATNGSTATSLTVTAASVTGDISGIYTVNQGSGATSVTATGQVTAIAVNSVGISVTNHSTATDLTVNAASVTGDIFGVFAFNHGSGATSVTATGPVIGTSGYGIGAYNDSGATSLTVNAAGVSGNLYGIWAENLGSGAASVTTTGPVTATSGYGIVVSNGVTATSATVNAAGVSGAVHGIFVTNQGSGATSITTSGIVEGGTSAITALSTGTAITITTNALVRNLSQLPTDLAVETSGGSVWLTNAGGMIGTVRLNVPVAGGGNTMDNRATWNTAGGVNAFGEGTLTNAAGGTIVAAASAATLPVTTTFGGLGSFVNQGTLTMANGVAGDIVSQTGGHATFAAGSVFAIDVNAAGQADRYVTTGTVTINGGTVQVLAGAGEYAPSTTYTIVTANGGRTGGFDGVTSNLAFLDPSLSYDANNVYLTMTRNAVLFQNVGVTPNQIATGGGVESSGPGHPVYDAVLTLSAPQARYAFDQLSGEVHASAKTAMLEDSRFIRNAVNDRLRGSFDGVGAAAMPVMAYAAGGPQYVPATTDRFAVWGQAFGSWGHWNGDGNAARFNRSIGGFFIGADVPVFDSWRFGAVAGYSRTSFNVRDRASTGSSDNYHLGLYGGTAWGDFALRTGAAATWHDISTGRSVIFPGFGDSLKGNYTAATAQVFGELAYGFRFGRARFEPFANFAYVNLHTGGFTERGGTAALTSVASSTNAAFATLGLRASTTFDLGGTTLTAKGMLGWRHAFGDATPLSTMRFAGSDAFTIAGVPIALNAAVVEAGLDYAIAPNATLGVFYSGQFGGSAIDQSVRANLNVKF